MRRILRHRPSPAMVVACLALAITLGGTSYAAVSLPRNSVGTKQLKTNAVTSIKVRNDALTGADILEARLGRVPSATNAVNATNATTAASATNATNAANADKLDNLDSTNLLPGGTVPSGVTIKGTYGILYVASSLGSPDVTAFSFGATLAAAPIAVQANFIPETGSPTTNCPGSPTNPQAAPGHLCVYERAGDNRNTLCITGSSFSCGGAEPYGAGIFMTAAAAGFANSYGTWAVTAP